MILEEAQPRRWIEPLRLTLRTERLAKRFGLNTLLVALKECSCGKDLGRGKRLHGEAAQTGDLSNRYVCNNLINMYARCSRITDARNVFDSMLAPNVVSWNSLLQGYVENGDCELSLELFRGMRDGCSPDGRTYLAALTACSTLAAERDGEAWKWLEQGKSIHSQAALSNCCDMFVESALVGLYSKCGSMNLARDVFESLPRRDIVCWNALLQGYGENGEFETVMRLFQDLERGAAGCSPNARTYLAALTACTALVQRERVSGKSMESSRWLAEGRGMYSRAAGSGCCDMFVENVVMDMYVKAGCMPAARRVFDRMPRRDVVSFNVLLHGYVENGENLAALEVFSGMEGGGGGCCSPDARSYVAALAACAALGGKESRESAGALHWLQKAKEVYLGAKSRNLADIFVYTALLNAHVKCGSMSAARRFFDGMPQRSVVSWTCLVQGYVEDSQNGRALRLLAEMDQNGVSPTPATFVAGLMACGNAQSVDRGLEFDAESRARGFDKDVLVATALVDFHGKCGNMEAARGAFESIVVKDLWAWNTLMSGYSQQGDSSAVLDSFERMKRQGLAPNDVTFTQLLTACSHAGMTDKGEEIFRDMERKYGVSPDIMHYNCVVDLLARANKLDEAVKVARSMPFKANGVTWTSILGACRKWNNAAVGKVAYEALLKLDERDPGPYLLMSTIYGNNETNQP